jgi:hypothetical protein
MNHYLYRFTDTDGRLLYVGESVCALTRAAEHRRSSPWWWRVAGMHISILATRDEALRAETAAIRTEGPLFNRKMSPSDKSQVYADEKARADEHIIARHVKPPIPLPTYDGMDSSIGQIAIARDKALIEQMVRVRALEWVEQLRDQMWRLIMDAESAWAHAEESAAKPHYSKRWSIMREISWRQFWRRAA